MNNSIEHARCLTRTEAAALLGVKPKTLANSAGTPDSPPMVYVGPRMPRYRLGDLLEWIEARRAAHTTDADAKGLTPRGRRRLAAQGQNV